MSQSSQFPVSSTTSTDPRIVVTGPIEPAPGPNIPGNPFPALITDVPFYFYGVVDSDPRHRLYAMSSEKFYLEPEFSKPIHGLLFFLNNIGKVLNFDRTSCLDGIFCPNVDRYGKCPRKHQDQEILQCTKVIDGMHDKTWTVLAAWDRRRDDRFGSQSVVLCQADVEVDQLWTLCKQHGIFKRCTYKWFQKWK